MTTRQIAQWTIEVDIPRTKDVYSKHIGGSPSDCQCSICHNFSALGMSAFPPEFISLANDLGIDIHKAAEIHEWSEPQNGFIDYGGWFHCIGNIVKGSTEATKSHKVEQWNWHNLSGNFKIVLDSKSDIAFSEFQNEPLIRIEFFATLPWTLNESFNNGGTAHNKAKNDAGKIRG